MRAPRIVLSILAVIAIAFAAPVVAHARTLGYAADLAYDDDPDVPVTLDAVDIPSGDVICSFVLVDLAWMHEPRSLDARPPLAFAPKTSPPSR